MTKQVKHIVTQKLSTWLPKQFVMLAHQFRLLSLVHNITFLSQAEWIVHFEYRGLMSSFSATTEAIEHIWWRQHDKQRYRLECPSLELYEFWAVVWKIRVHHGLRFLHDRNPIKIKLCWWGAKVKLVTNHYHARKAFCGNYGERFAWPCLWNKIIYNSKLTSNRSI